MRLGVIATSSLPIPAGAKFGVVPTRHGDSPYFEIDDVFYFRRAGWRHPLAPTMINTRAIALALSDLGIRAVLSTCVVGALSSDIEVGTIGLLSQFLDFHKMRPVSIFEGDQDFRFTDVSNPFCGGAQGTLQNNGTPSGVTATDLCYVGVDGPRYETAAEVRMFRSFGGDVVGHTSVPEAIMLRELGLCHIGLVQVSNHAAGVQSSLVSNDEILAVRNDRAGELQSVVALALTDLRSAGTWECACSIAPGTLQVSNRTARLGPDR